MEKDMTAMTNNNVVLPRLSEGHITSQEICGNVAGMMFYGLCGTALTVAGIAASSGSIGWFMTAVVCAPVLAILGYGLFLAARNFARPLKAIENAPQAG